MDPVSKAKIQSNQENRLARFGDKLTQWKPGQSGNPGGKKRVNPELSNIYNEVFDDPKVRERIKNQIIQTMTSPGMAGVLERREAGERIEGKVVTTVDMSVTGTITLEAVLEARKKAGKE